ncbi:hypothetical protein FRB91_008235 [Serendipita sp. 411]
MSMDGNRSIQNAYEAYIDNKEIPVQMTRYLLSMTFQLLTPLLSVILSAGAMSKLKSAQWTPSVASSGFTPTKGTATGRSQGLMARRGRWKHGLRRQPQNRGAQEEARIETWRRRMQRSDIDMKHLKAIR